MIRLSFILATLLLQGCFSSSSSDSEPLIIEKLVRPQNLTCLAKEAPVQTSSVKFVNAFPNLEMGTIIQAYRMPENYDEWFYIHRQGFVYKFDDKPDVSEKTLLLDISDKVISPYSELGLLGMAFHPNYQENQKVYLYYSYLNENDERFTTLSEYTFDEENDVLTDEVMLITLRQYTQNHQGGNIVFGPDGYLYFAYGDDGRKQKAQQLDDLYGKMIRIDVPGDGTYTIPSDNPFVNVEGARGEIWALGFRHPWRWGIDKETGEIWVGDVGANNLEEVDKVVKGGNYGWPIKEGTSCSLAEGCDAYEDLIDPVLEYSHEEGWGAIIGGEVYRGTKIPGLIGSYIYADFSAYSQILALEYDEELKPFGKVLFKGRLASPGGIHAFTSDHDGEIFVTHLAGIFKMVPDDSEPTEQSEFPQFLSDTGCFSKQNGLTKPVESAIPYDIASPLYSDGSDKRRWMAIPDGSEIDVTDNGDFIYPLGSVLMKEFAFAGKKIETRLLMKNNNDKWDGYTYEWNEEQTDAVLLAAGKVVDIDDIQYQIPNRVQCQSCHNPSINGAIGPEVRQLNIEKKYSETVNLNQIDYLAEIGFLDSGVVNKKQELTALPDYHTTNLSDEDRVNSFVHSNCASCHNPQGTERTSIDFTWKGTEQWGACDKDPQVSSLDIENAKLMAPGDPERSIIYKRLNTTEPYKMPPIGRSTIAPEVVDLFHSYISNVECK